MTFHTKTYHETRWKTRHPSYNPSDSYHKLNQKDQTKIYFDLALITIDLSTACTKLSKLVSHPNVPVTAETTSHILQSCPSYNDLGDSIWSISHL